MNLSLWVASRRPALALARGWFNLAELAPLYWRIA